MNRDIAEAKRRLPLPALMHRLGLGAHAKKSAKCPFHDDQQNSFSVWQRQDGSPRFKCHAGCGEGDEITFLELHHRISNTEATKLFLEMASPPQLGDEDGVVGGLAHVSIPTTTAVTARLHFC